MTTLGFIGLGIMGAPMAGHLIAAGHTVYLQTRSRVPAELLDAGGISCARAQELAQKADLIFMMPPDTTNVEDALFCKMGVAEGFSPGQTRGD